MTAAELADKIHTVASFENDPHAEIIKLIEAYGKEQRREAVEDILQKVHNMKAAIETFRPHDTL